MTHNDKTTALRNQGTLNRHPQEVSDEKFREGDFFDPRDLVQVKYEMLRRVQTDKVPVTQAVAESGFTRPTFYEAKADFQQAGIAGLVPRKRGPHGPHKLRGEVADFLGERIVPGQPIRAAALAKEIRKKFGVRIHPRTIERAANSRKKKAPS